MSIFTQRIGRAYDIVTLPEDIKVDILIKFAILADELIKGKSSPLIMENLDCYNAICNREMMYMLRYDRQSNYFIRTAANYPKINNILGSATNIEDTLVKLNGIVNTTSELSKNELILALRSFGVKAVDNLDGNVDIIDTNEADDDLKALEEAIASQIDTSPSVDIDEMPDFSDYEGMEDTSIENSDSWEDDFDKEYEDSSEIVEDTSKGTHETDGNLSYSDEFAEVWSDELEQSVIAGLLSSFRALYESCYSGITSPDGILTKDGILSFEKPVKGTTNPSEVSAEAMHKADKYGNERIFILNHGRLNQAKSYIGIYKAIMYAYGVTYGGASPLTNASVEEQKRIVNNAVMAGENIFGHIIDGRKDSMPKWADIANQNYMYPRLHEEYMTGYLKINKKLENWASKNKVHKNSVRITSYTSMEQWIKKSLLDCMLQALHDYVGPNGERITIQSDTVDILPICQKVANSVKNIIAVTANKKGYRTVKVCSNISGINGDLIGDKIEAYLSWSTAGSQSVKVVAKGNVSDVLEFDIITDEKAYNSSSSFASSVIDDILASGQLPSWSNALLGEKNEGGAFTYNFKNKNSVSIYGASGSGKGIMTSALLSNALIDNCYVFYFDGKPDNGAALGKVVWDKQLGDAPVFNGLQGGSNTFPDHLENYSHGMRPVSWRSMCDKYIPFIEADKNDITRPAFPFNDEINKTLLKEVSYTLLAFQFVHDMILLRTEPQYVRDRWAVFVIDEIQDAALSEKRLRGIMTEYMNAVGEIDVFKTETKTDRNGNVTTSEKRDGKIKDRRNWHKDTGYLFCQKWLHWADNLCSNWDTVVTKALRNSSSTMITIFQSNSWLTQDNKGAGKTKIGMLMLKVAAKTTKIVGKGALVSANQWGDETDYKWTKETAKGKWAISAGEEGLKDTDQVFRPFKCFTTDLGADVAVPLDDVGAGSENCRKFKGDKGNDPVGLQSYLNYLFNGMQSEINEQISLGNRLPNSNTAEQVLMSSFSYFDEMLRLGNKRYANDSQGLLHYMYSIPCLASDVDLPVENGEEGTGYYDDTPNDSMTQNVDIYNQSIGFEAEDGDDDEIDLATPQGFGQQQQGNPGVNTQTFSQGNQVLSDLDNYAGVAQEFSSVEPQTSSFQFGDEDESDLLDFGATDSYSQGNNWTDNNGNNQGDYIETEVPVDEYTGDIDYRQVYGEAFFKPEQMPINNSSNTETFGRNMRKYKITPDSASHAWDLNDNNCIMVNMPEYDTSERFNNRFFRTVKGTEWEFNRRWKIVLKSISARVSSKDLINRVLIKEDEMKVNGRFVALNGVVGGFENIEFRDIVNFKMLSKEFKNITELTIDNTIYAQAALETADGKVTSYLFNTMPKLQELRVLNGNRGISISRNGFRTQEERRMAEEMEQAALFRQQFKAMSSSQDPRFSQRSPGDQRNSFRAVNVFPEDIRATASNQFKRSSKSFLGGTTHTIGTVGAIVVGGIAGSIAGIWHWFNKR